MVSTKDAKPRAKPSGGKQGGGGHGFSKAAGVTKPAFAKARPSGHAAGGHANYKAKPSGHAAGGHANYKAAPSAPQERLSKKEQKIAKREKFAVIKKNFNIIQDAAQLWELLRPKNTPDEERRELVNKIITKVHGKVLELAQHHTASRIIQFCLKYGSEEQQAAIKAEVKASIIELSKGKHSHYLVQKLVAIAKKEELPGMLSQFKGHVAELLRHPRAADVLVDLYDVATTEQRNGLCAEFYGMEYVLFDGINTPGGRLTGLKQLLAGVSVTKRRAVYQHMTRALMPILEKAILHPPMVHRLVREFLENAPSLSVEDVVDTMTQTGTALLKMVHTHDGAASVCMLIAYGSAKDRKRLIRTMKGHVHDMALNEWGHAVLCTVFGVIDDTALLTKTLWPELKAMLPEAVEDQYAHRLLLQLLCPDSKRYLPQAVMELMHPAPRTVVGTSGKMVTDIEGDEDEVDIHASLRSKAGDDGDEEAAQPSTSKKQGRAAGKGGKRSRQEQNAKKNESAVEQDAAGSEDEEPAAEDGGAATRVLGVSKKDAELRRRELLGQGPTSLSALLCALVAEQAGTLLRSPHGSNIVVEVALGGSGGLLQALCPEGVAKVQQAVAAIVGLSNEEQEEEDKVKEEEEEEDKVQQAVATIVGTPEAGAASQDTDRPGPGPGPQQEHVMVHYYASRALRRLILSTAEPGTSSSCGQACAEALWSSALSGRCKAWVGTHADKVLGALLHCGSSSVKAAAAKELAPLLPGKDLQQWPYPNASTQDQPQKDRQLKGKGKQQGKVGGQPNKQEQKQPQKQQKQQQKQQQKPAAGAKRPGAKVERSVQAPAKRQAASKR